MKVCKGCGEVPMAIDNYGNPSCITCFGISPDSGILIEVPEPEEYSCDLCKRTYTREELVKKWVRIPFATSKGKFYCGCMGWC